MVNGGNSNMPLPVTTQLQKKVKTLLIENKNVFNTAKDEIHTEKKR